MVPSTLLAPYVGEPYNQQVFEHLPSTVRQILFVFLSPRNCTSTVKGFSAYGTSFPISGTTTTLITYEQQGYT